VDELEQGWSQLQNGDAAAAIASAERALKKDAQSSDALTLKGAALAASGHADESLAAFRQAMKLDPEAVEPALLGAEAAADAGDADAALALCDEALDRAEEEDEFLEAVLLKAELQIEIDDAEGARATLAELPPPEVELPDVGLNLRAGEALLQLDQLDEAEQQFQAAAQREPEAADAWYGLGLVADLRDDTAARRAHFEKVRALDLAAPRPPWALGHERIEKLVDAALAELPERARTLLGNVPILVEDYPSAEQVAEGLDPRLLGLFTGTPFPEQSSLGMPPHLEHVVLYQRNIERQAVSETDLEEEIRITLLHETGHFFGLDEDELEELGLD
jgi:predicted Zn-dependent protease with MMP-like domain